MYVPNVPDRITLRVTPKARKRKTKFLRPKSVSSEEGFSEMSHSPSDLAAGWTFLSTPHEISEEMQNVSLDVTEGKSDLKDECVDATKDKSSGVEQVMDEREIELGDDLPSISSESESLPSSDVDILEESVGPDHDMLQVSSISQTSLFSISSPLEGMSKSQYNDSSNIPSELAEIRNVIQCELEKHLPVVSSVKSPKHLTEIASNAQPVQSSTTPDTLSCPQTEEVSEEQGSEQKSIKRKEKRVLKLKRLQHKPVISRSLLVEIREINRDIVSRQGATVYLLLYLAVVIAFFWLIPYPSDVKYLSPRTAAQLKSVQDETLKCLGLQHLTAMENNHYGMLLSNVCVNDSVAWKSNFEKLLEDKVLKPLLTKVYHESSIQKKSEIIEEFMSEARNNVEGIKFDLLLRQLEYLELLHPVEEDSHEKEKYKESAVPHLFSEKLEEQQQLLGQLHQFINQLKLGNFALKSLDAELTAMDGIEDPADLAALKPRVYRLELENTFLSSQLQRVLDQFESGEFLNPEYWMESPNLNDDAKNFKSNKMEELIEKVNSLLSANDELRRMYSHFSDLKPEIKNGDKETATAEKETNSKQHGFSENGIENRESLVKELLSLHQTLSGELKEIRKWNEMLTDITDELRSSHRGKNNGPWTWSTFKQAFGGMFNGAHLDWTQRLENIKNLGVSKLLRKYAEDRRPFIKDVFQSIKSFWENTGLKSREFIDKALHEMNADFSLSGMFNSAGDHEEFPGESETSDRDEPENNLGQQPNNDFQDGLPSAQRNKDLNCFGDLNGHPELSAFGHKSAADFDKFKADWLFQRAADRESLRHTAKTKPINWYLRREQNMWRSPMTKEQTELLEKMEVSQYPAPAKSFSRESKDHEA